LRTRRQPSGLKTNCPAANGAIPACNGLRIGRVGRGQFEARVRELVADDPLIAG
jgi:hypothetical protein